MTKTMQDIIQGQKEVKNIYKMIYDCDHNKDGTMRENRYLGTFTVVEQISEDLYSEEFIGIREEDNKLYKVLGREVSGYGGGVLYEVVEMDVLREVEKLEQKLEKLKQLLDNLQ